VIQQCTGIEKLHDAAPPPPPPPPPPPLSQLCTNTAVNTEPEILAAYSPYTGQTVGANGQIKVWVDDENAPFIAPGEVVDPTTGTITTPGNRTAKAPDGYLWEPATLIKGQYSNNPPVRGTGVQGAPVDPIPPGTPPPAANPRPGRATYHAEYVWDVSSLKLPPGSYSAEFLIYDGDKDRGIGCVNIVISP
jgi:hypothetical protein